MQVIMYQANAFTDQLFEGSPIGIVPDARNLTEENMKRIVEITNLDKIAFITSNYDECYNLRFFNSEEEIDFCDCATVASFYALAERGYIKGVENGSVRAYECTPAGKKPIDIFFKDGEVDRVELSEQRPIIISDNLDIEEISLALKLDASDIGIEGFDAKPQIMQRDFKELILPLKSSQVLDQMVINIEDLKSDPTFQNIDKLYLFSIDENETINYTCLEFKIKTGCRNDNVTSSLMYYIKKNNLLSNDNLTYQSKSLKSKRHHMQCEILENQDDFSIKIGGRASIYLEGVVTFG